MIGQTALQERFTKYTRQTLPHTILLVGESGCGKHTLIHELTDRLQMDCIEINQQVEPEVLLEYQQYPVARMYIIDVSKLEPKWQNQFLKFIEEPSVNMYVAVLAETDATLLPTVLNRCQKFYFAPYTIDELKYIRIYPNELIYKICTTPGQVLKVNYLAFDALYKKAVALSTISSGNYANTVSVACLINYKEDYDKFDFDLFLRALRFAAYTEYVENGCERALGVYNIVCRHMQKMLNKNIVKESFMINLLSDIWQHAEAK